MLWHFVRKTEQLHSFQKDFGIEQSLEWKRGTIAVSLSLELPTGENAAVALEAFFLYMEGLDQEVLYRIIKHALQTRCRAV